MSATVTLMEFATGTIESRKRCTSLLSMLQTTCHQMPGAEQTVNSCNLKRQKRRKKKKFVSKRYSATIESLEKPPRSAATKVALKLFYQRPQRQAIENQPTSDLTKKMQLKKNKITVYNAH